MFHVSTWLNTKDWLPTSARPPDCSHVIAHIPYKHLLTATMTSVRNLLPASNACRRTNALRSPGCVQQPEYASAVTRVCGLCTHIQRVKPMPAAASVRGDAAGAGSNRCHTALHTPRSQPGRPYPKKRSDARCNSLPSELKADEASARGEKHGGKPFRHIMVAVDDSKARKGHAHTSNRQQPPC